MNISTDLNKLSPDEFEKLTVGPQSTREIAKTFEESSKLYCFWGNKITDDKIKMIDNQFVSTVPLASKKKYLFVKFMDWIKRLFK